MGYGYMTRASPLMSHLPSALNSDVTHPKQGMIVVVVPAIICCDWATIDFC